MAVNILDLFRNQVEGTLVSAASGFLSENPASVRNALDLIAPTLLGALVQKGSTELGSSSILNMIMQEDYDTSTLNDLNGLTADDGSRINNIMNKGLPIVRSLLGDKAGNIIDWIAVKSNISSGSVSSLMSMTAPFLLGLIGRNVKTENNTVGGLSNLLYEQSPYVKSLIPSGLAGITSYTALNNPVVVEPVATTGYIPPVQTTDVPPQRPEEEKSGMGGFLPWLLLLVGLGLIWYFAKSCKNEKVVETMDKTEVVVDSIQEDVSEAADSVKVDANAAYQALKGKVDDLGNWVSDLGKDYTVKLPNGKEIRVYEESVERRLVDFINTGTTDEQVLKDKWFSFDRLYFKSGKSELTNDSKNQLDNIAEILKAYTKVNIKMGGYTDNVGDDAFNQTLSQERAAAARKELQTRGISGNRIEAEGYGEQFPRCPANDTKECKAQNRRIDIRITKM